MSIRKNDICTITITDIGNHGEGIGKIDGYTLFVKNTLPGEEVRVLVVKANKSYGYGKALDIITPSPHRIKQENAEAVPYSILNIRNSLSSSKTR